MRKLKTGEVIKSTQKKNAYKIGDRLGEGGFGCAYRATAVMGGRKWANDVCLKITDDQASWHRESYFGELLSKNRRVIEMYESFVLAPRTSRSRMLYCIALELAQHGDLLTYLEKTGLPWKTERVKREIGGLLKVLDQLHGGSATHRDITPMNIFVCGGGILKLGDFGIARHELAGTRATVTALNWWFAPPGVLGKIHPHWEACDDVYQMGQLMGMLLWGDTENRITIGIVNKLDCDKETKAIIKCAIGPRKDRYADAFEMLQDVEGKAEDKRPALRSIKGKKVVFTGRLSIKRFDAKVLVLQAGGTVRKEVTPTVNVIVQGGRSPLYKKGHKGRKLLDAQKLIKQGRKIYIIGEPKFRRLVRKRP